MAARSAVPFATVLVLGPAFFLFAGPVQGIQGIPAAESEAWLRLETSPRLAEWVSVGMAGGEGISA